MGELQICYFGLPRAYFGLLRRRVEGVPWETVLRDKGVQEGRAELKRKS